LNARATPRGATSPIEPACEGLTGPSAVSQDHQQSHRTITRTLPPHLLSNQPAWAARDHPPAVSQDHHSGATSPPAVPACKCRCGAVDCRRGAAPCHSSTAHVTAAQSPRCRPRVFASRRGRMTGWWPRMKPRVKCLEPQRARTCTGATPADGASRACSVRLVAPVRRLLPAAGRAPCRRKWAQLDAGHVCCAAGGGGRARSRACREIGVRM
jgi:hypothetical protein